MEICRNRLGVNTPWCRFDVVWFVAPCRGGRGKGEFLVQYLLGVQPLQAEKLHLTSVFCRYFRCT